MEAISAFLTETGALAVILLAGWLAATALYRGALAVDIAWRRFDVWATIRLRHALRRRRHRRRTGHRRCLAT